MRWKPSFWICVLVVWFKRHVTLFHLDCDPSVYRVDADACLFNSVDRSELRSLGGVGPGRKIGPTLVRCVPSERHSGWSRLLEQINSRKGQHQRIITIYDQLVPFYVLSKLSESSSIRYL